MDLEASPSRRDRKKHDTRRALRWAALELVAERGFANVTVEDIAEAADVSTRTFFNYFASKEDALVGEDPELFEELRAALVARPPEESAFEAVRAVVLEQCERLAHEANGDSTTWYRRMKTVHADPQLRAARVAQMAAYERVILMAIAERLGADPDTDPYPALLAATAFAASRVGIMYWARSGGGGSPAALTDAAFAALASGLGNLDTLAAAFAESMDEPPSSTGTASRKRACP